MVINFPVGTGSHTFDNAADVFLTKTMIVQFVKPCLIASFGIRNNTPKKTGKRTDDIQEQISTSLIGSLTGLINQSDIKMCKSCFSPPLNPPPNCVLREMLWALGSNLFLTYLATFSPSTQANMTSLKCEQTLELPLPLKSSCNIPPFHGWVVGYGHKS